MKFTMAIQKHGKVSIGRAEGHNARQHPTASQLPKAAWITKDGRHTITPWRADVLDGAKALAKRKDAVVAIEIVIQVGNQTDWRHPPTEADPEGKPKAGAGARLKALHRAALEAIERDFGKGNVVSIELHTDESTPHVHAIVVPIKDGKLQAKSWLDGAARCAQLRERIHATVSKHIECEYTKGAPGGEPHDPGKAAGQPGGQPPDAGLLEWVKEAMASRAEVKALRESFAALEAQVQTLYSQLKASIKTADLRYEAMTAERSKAIELAKKLDQAQAEIKRQRVEIDRLTPKPEAPAQAPVPTRETPPTPWPKTGPRL
jgi:hypothetical protein